MTTRIYKERAQVADAITLTLPWHSQVLHVDDQGGFGGFLDFWYIEGTGSERTEEWEFRVFGTGHEIDGEVLREFEHLDTVVTHGGTLVWHVFVKAPDRSRG